MRFRFLLLPLCVLVIVSGVLLAQSVRVNRAIPACDSDQAQQMVRLLDRGGAAEAYSTLLVHAAEGDIQDNLGALVEEAIALRQLVYDNVLPDVPTCAGAMRVADSFRRVVDDATLALALATFDTGAEAVNSYSAMLATGLSDNTTEATAQLRELAEVIEAE
jgi:hypothetical protein